MIDHFRPQSRGMRISIATVALACGCVANQNLVNRQYPTDWAPLTSGVPCDSIDGQYLNAAVASTVEDGSGLLLLSDLIQTANVSSYGTIADATATAVVTITTQSLSANILAPGAQAARPISGHGTWRCMTDGGVSITFPTINSASEGNLYGKLAPEIQLLRATDGSLAVRVGGRTSDAPWRKLAPAFPIWVRFDRAP